MIPLPYLARMHLRAADRALGEHARNPSSPSAIIEATVQIEAATMAIRLARGSS